MSTTINPYDAIASEYIAQGTTIYDQQLSEAMKQLENTTAGSPEADESRGNIYLAMNAITRESFKDGLRMGLKLATGWAED